MTAGGSHRRSDNRRKTAGITAAWQILARRSSNQTRGPNNESHQDLGLERRAGTRVDLVDGSPDHRDEHGIALEYRIAFGIVVLDPALAFVTVVEAG